VSELLCRSRKQPEPVVVLQRGAMALAQIAHATQPACVNDLGEAHQHLRTLLPVDQDTTPTAMSPLRRQNPREEPGALAAHAGIRAGGRGAILVPTATINAFMRELLTSLDLGSRASGWNTGRRSARR